MRKFSIDMFGLDTWYNHYLSDLFLDKHCILREEYPLKYWSRKFDKPAIKWRDGTCFWKLDDEWHRIGKPAWIWSDGKVGYWENGGMIK